MEVVGWICFTSVCRARYLCYVVKWICLVAEFLGYLSFFSFFPPSFLYFFPFFCNRREMYSMVACFFQMVLKLLLFCASETYLVTGVWSCHAKLRCDHVVFCCNGGIVI